MGTLADLAESGDADALSAAIADGAHLDEADDEGNTATHKAAQGEPECLRLLLSHLSPADGDDALPPRVRAGKDERRGQLAVRRYPFTRPTIRAVREDFGTAPEDFGTRSCIIKFRTTWRRRESLASIIRRHPLTVQADE